MLAPPAAATAQDSRPLSGPSNAPPGASSRLTSVTYSTSPPSTQTYLYENSAFPDWLTGIIDEDGNRLVFGESIAA